MCEKLGPNGPERFGSLPCDKLPAVAEEHIGVSVAHLQRGLISRTEMCQMVTGEGVPHDVVPPSDACRPPDGFKPLLSVVQGQVAPEFQPRGQVVGNRHQSPLSGLGFAPVDVNAMRGNVLPIKAHYFLWTNSGEKAKRKVRDQLGVFLLGRCHESPNLAGRKDTRLALIRLGLHHPLDWVCRCVLLLHTPSEKRANLGDDSIHRAALPAPLAKPFLDHARGDLVTMPAFESFS